MLANAAFVYQAGPCEIDRGRRELRVRGVPAAIGSRAFEIIEKLAQSAGRLVTKDELIAHAWPGITVGGNTLPVHIAAIRKALGPHRAMLKTVSGRGYRLVGEWCVRESVAAKTHEAAKPIIALDTRLANLPVRNTDLIGRTEPLSLLRDRLTAYRIVTLVGSAGIGKTSLALEVARSLLDDFAEGVWFVDLSAFQDPKLLASAVARTLGLRLSGETISPETVARAISSSELLLLLDNCEHVVEAAAAFAEAMVQRCPNVTVLATSRETLWIAGECIYRVPALDVPATDREGLRRLLECSSVKLFVARAQTLEPDFSPDESNAEAIAAICRHLDGIPLAIELAAARASTLGTREVAAGLSDRFALLTNQRRTALPRHQTLRASLDWSYELLSRHEQRLLCHLAVFAGDFSLQAVVAVADTLEAHPIDVTGTIANLVSKSLVVFDGAATPGRWRLLETIRVYALSELKATGEYPAAARRHAQYYQDLIVSLSAGSKVQLDAGNVARCSTRWT